jgi:peptidoglycan/xylan/chitin deacetylase (PgdA/CDA1 family)
MIGQRSLKAFAKVIGSPVIDATGVYESRIRRHAAGPGRWTIVMYHRVIDDPAHDPFRLGMCVTLPHFERQIRYLRSSFNILPVRDAMRRLDAGDPLPERALSVTFDDGYLDTLTCALPVLERYTVPFSVYVPTGEIESGQRLWWDRVIDAVAATPCASLDFERLGLAETGATLALDDVQRADGVERLLGLLWDLPAQPRLDAIARIEQQLAPAASSGSRRLTPVQLQDLHRRGVEIGAHSVTHPNLCVAANGEVRSEMALSRMYLETLLQQAVDGFAYPGGRMSADTAAVARELGFRYALATTSGVNTTPFDAFALRRIGMPDAPLADFRRAFSRAMARGAVAVQRF